MGVGPPFVLVEERSEANLTFGRAWLTAGGQAIGGRHASCAGSRGGRDEPGAGAASLALRAPEWRSSATGPVLGETARQAAGVLACRQRVVGQAGCGGKKDGPSRNAVTQVQPELAREADRVSLGAGEEALGPRPRRPIGEL